MPLRDTGDFRLMSRRVVTAVCKLARAASFHEGAVRLGWLSDHLGARADRAPCADVDARKWNYWKLWNLALEGITSFTVMPLKVATYLGLMVALLSVG